MQYRIEKDTMGEVKVPADKLWGAQTERSFENFKIGPRASMPLEIIYGFAYLKKAAAFTNCELGVLPEEKRDLIATVCDEILSGKHDDIVRIADKRDILFFQISIQDRQVNVAQQVA